MTRSLPHWTIPLLCGLAALISAGLMFSQGTRLEDGSPVLPLDDSYIHLQYAAQAADGHFLQYNTGDAPTTGATSLLYMLILTGGFRLGIGHEAMPAAVLWLGVVLFVTSSALMSDLARRIAPQQDKEIGGLLAGLIFAGSGWMAWSFLSGMETGLLILLVCASLWAVASERHALAAFCAALAALTRPEALLLGAVILASDLFIVARERRWPDRNRLMWSVMPLIIALIPFGLNYLLTGSLGSSGLQAKSWFTITPFYPQVIAGKIVSIVLELLGLTYGFAAPDGLWHAFPLVQLLALAGMILLWRRGDPMAQHIGLISAGWIVLGTLASSSLQTATWHHYRYQMPYYPTLILLGVIAWAQIMDAISSRIAQKIMPAFSITATLAWGVVSISTFAGQYQTDTRTISQMQISLSRWIAANIPDGSLIAVHDVGAIRYFGGRDTFDVVGLTTAGMPEVNRNGPGSTYEALESIQPDYYAVYLDSAPPFWGVEQTPDLLGKELYRVDVPDFSPYTSAHPVQVITGPDWSDTPTSDSPQQPAVLAHLDGWQQIDQVDVADLASEKAHAYHWWNNGTPAGFASEPRRALMGGLIVTDGGRLMTGGEEFTLATHPGQNLILVARLHQTADMVLDVQADGKPAGQWKLPALPGQWIETLHTIPANLITGNLTRITLTVASMFDAPPEARFSPFHYWAYQGNREHTPSDPHTPLNVAFENTVRLLGFDSSPQPAHPGDTLKLTLHWQALDPQRAPLHIFIHLVDPSNPDTAEGIIAQVDSVPQGGIYPFWVWASGEIVIEPIRISLPADLTPGQYWLLLGIYDWSSGVRLSTSGGHDVGASRLLLDILDIE